MKIDERWQIPSEKKKKKNNYSNLTAQDEVVVVGQPFYHFLVVVGLVLLILTMSFLWCVFMWFACLSDLNLTFLTDKTKSGNQGW